MGGRNDEGGKSKRSIPKGKNRVNEEKKEKRQDEMSPNRSKSKAKA